MSSALKQDNCKNMAARRREYGEDTMTSGRQSTVGLYGVVSFKHRLVAQAIPFCISTLLIKYLDKYSILSMVIHRQLKVPPYS